MSRNEGRNKRIVISYQEGRSVVALHNEYGLARTTIDRILEQAGVSVRGRSEANALHCRARTETRRAAIEAAGGKICTCCREFKPLAEFKRRDKPMPWEPRCNPCRLKTQRDSTRRHTAKPGVREKLRKKDALRYQTPEFKKWAADRARRIGATPEGRLRKRMTDALNRCLRSGQKKSRTLAALGYDIEELRRHIERQFTKGMSWNRFLAGEIHIDHILPVSGFDIRQVGDQEFMACWALTNLRPMWAEDNWKNTPNGRCYYE